MENNGSVDGTNGTQIVSCLNSPFFPSNSVGSRLDGPCFGAVFLAWSVRKVLADELLPTSLLLRLSCPKDMGGSLNFREDATC